MRFCLLLLFLFAPLAAHAAPPNLLSADGWTLSSPNPSDAVQETKPVAGAPGGGDVLHFTINKPTDPFYAIQLVRGIPALIPEGHRVQLHFWARSTTGNPLRVTIERNGPPYDAILARTLTLLPEWTEQALQGEARDFPVSVHFQMGQQAGNIDLAGITVTDEGPDPAVAIAQAALAPAKIAARIEKYRKGSLTVSVIGADGRPVPNAQVKIAQTRHAFLFGANIFGLNPADTGASQKAYQDQYSALLNYATLPFYWGAYEGVQGKPDAPRLHTMADWCVRHGITPKGHPLVWHEVWPSWAPSDPSAAIPLLKARVFTLVPEFAETIHYWDVVNEAADGAGFQPPNGESLWNKRDGSAALVETALGWARQAGQGHAETFLYNDYNTGDANVALLTQLQKDGKLPDAVGIQSHMHGGTWPLEKVWTVAQRFSRFGRPIHFTEVTVLSGPHRDNPTNTTLTDWDTTPAEEQAQADYVVKFYTLLFSHPSVQAITWWDFSDKDAWQGAPAGLLRRDMTPKPAYTRLKALIHTQWWTTLSGRTNTHGTLARRVFYGDYTITVTDPKGRTRTQTVTFPEAAPPKSVTVRLPK